MINLLIYGGYHHDYVYTNHLAEGFSDIDDVNIFPAFLDNSKNKLLVKINYYFPPSNKIKNYLVNNIKTNKITHIINYNTNHFSSSFLVYLKKKFNLKISAYYNDSPFSSHLSKKLYYQNQKKAYLKYDNLFVYRDEDYKQLINQYGINESLIYLVPPSCPEKEFLNYIPITNNFLYDFAFVGHYEPDGRFNVISDLISRGFKCLIVGRDWPEDIALNFSPNISRITNKHFKYNDYLSLLSLSRVNIGFLSGINNDIYTRRYFECPFSNSLFLAYLSDYYQELSAGMPNIIFCKNKLPTIEDCIKALNISKLKDHYPTTKQKETFYRKNSIYARARIFTNFLYS